MLIHHTLGGRAYPVRHYPVAIRLRDRKGHAILCIALNPQSGDFSGAILGVRSVALLHLTKVLFEVWEFFGLSLVHPWFVLGLLPERDSEGTIEHNLKKQHIWVTNTIHHTIGGRAYSNAIRRQWTKKTNAQQIC